MPLALLAFIAGIFFAPTPANAQVFDPPGGSGSGWVQMFRGNFGSFGDDAPIADPGASHGFAEGLRMAAGVYSNALLIVASLILLYHLLVMVAETAHQGIVGGKRTNQIWAPIRLVIAVGLLVPLASGLNSGQYITLQIIEWGSNMATHVWNTFLSKSYEGTGTDPTPYLPDVGQIAREAAKIGACMHLMNNYAQKAGGGGGGGGSGQIQQKSYGPAMMWGNEKYESLCGSVIIFAMGPGAAAGIAGINMIIQQMQQYAPYFLEGNQQFNQDPGPAPDMDFAAAMGAIESTNGNWVSGAGSAGTGWVSAGSYFLALAAGGSNRVSGTDTLPIIMGPKSELIRPEKVQQAFYKMAEWIVRKYKTHASGGGADPYMMGNTVAGRKFVDLLLLFIDQLGVISGLWSPGSVAFYINLGNSPLAELVDLGHRMIRTSLDFVGAAVDLGVNEPQHAMYSSQVASKESKAFGPKSGLFWAMMAIPVLSAYASTLMTMGIWLGIFMPLLPFFKFILSVMTWLISVTETMICVPLMSLAYLTPYGDGFGGQKVEPGYYLVMHTFLRPVLTIFGVVVSVLLFNIAAHLITTFYQAVTQTAGAFKGAMYVVTKLSFGMMYVSMLYSALNAALKVVDTFGRHATRWLGGQAHEENLGDAQQAIQMAKEGTAMFGQIAGTLGYSALNAGQMLASNMAQSGGGGPQHGGGGGGGGGANPHANAPGTPGFNAHNGPGNFSMRPPAAPELPSSAGDNILPGGGGLAQIPNGNEPSTPPAVSGIPPVPGIAVTPAQPAIAASAAPHVPSTNNPAVWAAIGQAKPGSAGQHQQIFNAMMMDPNIHDMLPGEITRMAQGYVGSNLYATLGGWADEQRGEKPKR